MGRGATLQLISLHGIGYYIASLFIIAIATRLPDNNYARSRDSFFCIEPVHASLYISQPCIYKIYKMHDRYATRYRNLRIMLSFYAIRESRRELRDGRHVYSTYPQLFYKAVCDHRNYASRYLHPIINGFSFAKESTTRVIINDAIKS